MTAEWEPATEVEHALRAALQVGDEEGYFRVLAAAELLLPLYADESAPHDPATARNWATWHHEDRTHVLAYTSEQAMVTSFGGQVVPYHRAGIADVAAHWPDESWWLAVNPGLPIQGYLPAWFIGQLGQSEPQVPPDEAAAEPPPPAEPAAEPPAGWAPQPEPEPEPERLLVPAPVPIPEQRADHRDEPLPARPAAPVSDQPARPGPATTDPAATDPAATDFAATNEVERSLLTAARAGNTDAFLRTMLVANVFVPLSDEMPDDAAVGSPDFRWRVIRSAGHDSIVVFTSVERLGAHFGAGDRAARASLVQVIRAWPDASLPLALNPGTPIGASLPGEQVLSLAAWAGEMGLAERSDGETQPEVMQKVIPHHQLGYYLERGYNRVAGFVYRARDVIMFDTPATLYTALGLSGHGGTGDRPPFDVADEAVAVLRWPAYRAGLYKTPYGGRDETEMRNAGGWVIEGPPFEGNGYAPNDSAIPDYPVIPEYKVDSVLLPHGSEIYRIGREGGETLHASYDADGGRWIPVAEAGDAPPPPHHHDRSTNHDGYLARWRGRDCDASPDGEQVRLYADEPLPGFADLGGGRHVRVVPHAEIDDLWYRRTTCRWRDAPFAVLGAHGQWLRVEYTGGQAPQARRLGLEQYDIGVYQGWVPGNEVGDLREERI